VPGTIRTEEVIGEVVRLSRLGEKDEKRETEPLV
jgi:hypothetical protein